ncbi:hypothetical protein CEE37_10530 [candidate division LCP-89 bacterium B3_LCP]|uniref:Fibronectin type-III domain-containing protein n=1 Tax=candidate division LCP-89 bacterium B3_LCP TaxID=2012998 RepID=A0A532UXN2_UNCL8|nr:MAG: hypothetical protein CEE37_10530 [candidate division LCP-89 bacterium B3_LCP]
MNIKHPKVQMNMTCFIWILIALFTVLTRPTDAQPSIGLDAIEAIDELPLYIQGITADQVSSSDQTGGNSDRSGYLYQNDSLYVIFDKEGPGCIYRMWVRGTTTSANRRMVFYFDGEEEPTIDATVQQLFSGLYSPMLEPLAGGINVSEGGNYCYYPIKYAEHLKVAFIDDVEPHQICYKTYPSATALTSYDPAELPTNVLSQWQNTGTDPKDPTGNNYSNGSLTVGISSTETIFTYSGSGSITGIHFTPSPLTSSMLGSLRLRFYWDDSIDPQVECSFGSFFGNSLSTSNVDGLLVGVTGDVYYCYFPMPFWDNAHLDVYNSSLNQAVDIDYEISYKADIPPEDHGYFTAKLLEFTQSVPGQDMLFGELFGHGNFVGMVVTISSSQWPDFLGGDMRIYLDGQASPFFQGTDFDGDFNAGDYFASGIFSLPIHGAPAIQTGFERKICTYRFMLGDLIPYGNSIRILAEHGHDNLELIEYAATIYSYNHSEVALILSDHLDVGDPAEEATHSYVNQGTVSQETHYYAYPGTYDDEYFSDTGYIIEGAASFTATIDPYNEGVRLVRRRDALHFPQYAQVIVNGDTVGTWWDMENNYYKRWALSSFEIPPQYTQSLSEIDISIASGDSADWTEYFYWIYSHIPPREDLLPPNQVTSVSIEALENGSELFLQWDIPFDNSGVSGYRIYRDVTTGVQATEEFLVGQTVMTTYTDTGLIPGTQYFYLVSAVDYSSNEGEASVITTQITAINFIYEAEEIERFLGNSGDPYIVENMMQYGENWSNQHQLLYYSNNVGDYFNIPIEAATADTYLISGYCTMGSFYGNFRLWVNEEQVSDYIYLYDPNTIRSPLIEFGSHYLEEGENEFSFQVTGKNVASTDYCIGVDNLLITPYSLLSVPPSAPNSTPNEFGLSQNFPNPFNASTRIAFTLPVAGKVRLTIYDIGGRLVSRLLDGRLTAGQQNITWNAQDFASGIYFVRLEQESRKTTRKMVLMK